MEVVSVAASVGEVLGGPQPPPTPTFSDDHPLHAHNDHADRVRTDEEEDEDEVDSRMDTDQDAACDEGAGEDGPEDALAPHLEEESNPEAESAPLDDDAATDHMDCDDSESAPMFIDDDSSSRAFPEGAGDLSAAGGSPSAPSAALPEASRRNKRKNFKPRNIVYTYTDSDDTEGASDSEGRGRLAARDADNEGSSASELPLDLSETPTLRRTLLPRRLDEAVDLTGGGGVSVSGAGGSPLHPRLNALLARPTSPGPHEEGGPGGAEPSADMKEYAELTMRRLLGLYGFHDFAENLPPPPAAFFPGKLLESLKNNGVGGSGEGGAEPPTPPHTPQRDNAHSAPSDGGVGRLQPPPQVLEPLQQQALQARMLGGGNFSTLLTLAALQDGKGVPGHGVPLPPTMDTHKSLPTTPTTPTSTAVTPGLAGLSLGSGGSAPSSLVAGGMGVRDPLKPQLDYSRYVKPYSSALECGTLSCREHNLREHFHCLECDSKVFSKKEEMIRHFKWHKKRDESLQHGFMRYSPSDDCSDRFSSCSHNRKQTHYHCLKEGCDKVYISTSDVQMHANYHRKDSAIMQEGFQRFRASEDCNQPGCSFSGQRTTHFHCMRTGCNYTFKNKADMEKHKTYHIKDEQLTKDGFKKFMKQEECPYDGCKFSRVVNHIHCIRPECNYVLHSSGQIFAHKRKHERQDHERAYRKYKLAQTMLGMPEGHPALTPLLHEALRPLGSLAGHMVNPMVGPLGAPLAGPMCSADQRSEDSSSPLGPAPPPAAPAMPLGLQRPPGSLMGGFPPPGLVEAQHPLARLLGVAPPPASHGLFPGASATSSASTPASSSSGNASPVDLSLSMGGGDDREWERYVRCFSRDDVCRVGCDLSGAEHWHCDECETVFRGRESARDHGHVHEQQAAITEEHYTRVCAGEDPRPCPPECPVQDHADHFHCNWEGCGEAVLSSGDKPFRRLEHFRMHDYARRLALATSPGAAGAGGPMGVAAVTSVDAMFKRKRGRPPKNRIIEVWNDYLPVSSAHDSPQAIFTSFKLPKTSPPPHGPPLGMPPALASHPMTPLSHLAHMGRDASPPGLIMSSSANTSTSTTSSVVPQPATLGGPLGGPLGALQPVLLPLRGPLLANPLQPQAEVVDGFYPWAEGVACPDQLCPLLGRRHYHCAHPRCLYVTAHTDVLPLHAHDFHENTPIPEGFIAIDRNIDCRSPNCQSNKVNKHFHCTRCGFSFVRYQTLESHAEKHQQEDEGVAVAGGGGATHHSLGPQSPIYLKKPRPDSPMDTPASGGHAGRDSPSKGQDLSPPVVKSSGIFYPLSPFPTANPGSIRPPNAARGEPGALVTPIPPSTRPQMSTTFTLPVSGSLTITATRRSPGPQGAHSPARDRMEQGELDDRTNDFEADPARSLGVLGGDPYSARLLQQMTAEQAPLAAALGADWMNPERHPQYGPDFSCGRPFCKLKKKEHYHCQVCNQAFSEHEKLRPHLLKHAACGPMTPGSMASAGDEDPASAVKEEAEDGGHTPTESGERPASPRSPNESTSSSMSATPLAAPTSSPRSLNTSSISGNISGPQFPLVYTQAASFPGLPTPFGPHLGMAGMFPGTIPRLLPPAAWQVHPALAAMAHQGLMLPGVRPNGEMPHGSPGPAAMPGVNPGLPPGLQASGEHNPVLPATLGPSPHLALLGKRLGADDFSAQEAKKIRSNHSMRLLKDEPVPEGYVRFRFNEDCQYPHCGYREHQTHFHCMRKDCGYSFCDKTRFVQHTARHERLDTLMGGDFNQFRSNVPCGRPDCVYASMIGQQQNKASHFHCLKCDFVCTDTNKVVAHRRQHQKRDSINAAGFEKFTPSQPCGVQGCNHNQKQTHYHCLKCQYSVLGLSQMSAHRFRHLE